MALLIATFIACGPEEEIPGQLQGHWQTDDSRYEDRYFEIAGDQLVMKIGPGGFLVNPISGVESSPIDSVSLLQTIHYTDRDGEAWTLRVRMDSAQPDRLQLDNHDEVWTRTPI
jgi:hypothetical protein